jgi:phospholipase C
VLNSGISISGDGHAVIFSKTQTASAKVLPPNQGLQLQFGATEGTISISVAAYDAHKPSRTRSIGNPALGNFVTEFSHVPFKVELYAPEKSVPVAKWLSTVAGWSEVETIDFSHVIAPTDSKWGPWKCRVTSQATAAAQINVEVGYVFGRKPLLTAPIALDLLDQTYQVLLDALTPTATIESGNLVVGFGSELRRFFGASEPTITGTHIYPLDGLEGSGSLEKFELEACSGKELLAAMSARHQTRDADFRSLLNEGSMAASAALQGIEANDRWKLDWEQRVKSDFLTIHAKVSFSDIHLDIDADVLIGHIDVNIADITGAVADIYLAFDPEVRRCFALVLAPKLEAHSTLLDLATALGLLPRVNEFVEGRLPGLIEDAAGPLSRYLGEALARLCSRESVFIGATADDTAWRVKYATVPQEALGGSRQGGVVHVGETGLGDGGVVLGGGGGTTVPPDGQLPPADKFVVRRPETLARLDKVQTIVVVMMENRSFDHMLGYLRGTRGPAYEGVKGGESNSVDGRATSVALRPAAQVITGEHQSVTQIAHGPEHGFLHVHNQIANGAMSGFAQDYEKLFPGEAEMVMTYYTGAELPTYDKLASSFLVCDHWFAAHPGPTWPNRWTTMSGKTPYLENPPNNDPQLGFLGGLTIFDLLTNHGIEWCLFESDLSLIRTFDRYRLDTKRVKPMKNLRHPNESFAEMAKAGRLPPVVFVEPNFSDIPPLSSANDDLVPVDLRRGQKFISDVYTVLQKLPRAQRDGILMLVTYDEHGGFYDHVPPPGTELGPPEWLHKVPRIHPEGADHLGVRVPTMVVSSLVSAGSVCKEVFDHTSIIKTILLRHRRSFYTGEFTLFGERVNQAAHLGLALDLDMPRAGDWPDMPTIERRTTGSAGPMARPKVETDLGESLRHAFLPKRG